jgi:dTDP-4-amino-4,6-dideoxygalactose transaminase
MSALKTTPGELAIFGAEPAFREALPAGQRNFPSRERFEAAFRGIFARQYYTNQGPLTCELEQRLQDFLGVRHAICVTNSTIGLIMAAESLGLTGKVIVPGFSFIATAQSLSWAGLQPVFCDVDPRTHQICAQRAAELIDSDTSAILGVNLWGGACDQGALQALADKQGIALYFDSAHAFGGGINSVRVGNFGRIEVLSFHPDNVLNAADGGCLCTNDDMLAARLRNIRSSYGAGVLVDVVKTSNGRMSEAQAALALLGLEDYPALQARNKAAFDLYQTHLAGIPGIRLVVPAGLDESNHQSVVCEIDESQFGLGRDALLKVLAAEHIGARRCFSPGAHRSKPYIEDFPEYLDALPNTDGLCRTALQLPMGAQVDDSVIEQIAALLRMANRHASALHKKLGE